jgi:hypothetical protein
MGREFSQSFLELSEGDVVSPRNSPLRKFIGLAHVKEIRCRLGIKER